MTKYQSALAVATVALSPSCSSALSLFPQQNRASPGPAHISGARVGRAANIINTRRPISFLSRRSKFLPFQAVTEAKEDEAFFADEVPKNENTTGDDDEDDEKSWPVKPSPPDTPPPEKIKATPPPPPTLPYNLPSAPTPETTIDIDLSFLKPILNPTIAKNVPRTIIFGAFLNGAFLTLLTSFVLFGPLSVLFPPFMCLIAAASFGILTAYFSIIQGTIGDFVRGVGRATMEVGGGILGQVDVWRGEKEVNTVANALLAEPKAKKDAEKKADKSSMPLTEGMTGEEAAVMRNARLDAADEAAKTLGKQPQQQPVAVAVEAAPVASVDYDAAARLAYQASSGTGDFEAFKAQYSIDTSAMIAQKFQDAIAAEEEETKAKEAAVAEAAAAAAEETRQEEEAQLKAEEEARAMDIAAQLEAEEEEAQAWNAAQLRAKVEEEARVAMMQARLMAQEDARAAQEEAVRAAAEEQTRLQAEEHARATEEQARLQAEEARARAAAEEKARLAEMKKIAEEEERLMVEEQATAAREAVRLMEEQEALMDDDDVDDDDELDDEDWEASVRLANELQGGMPLPSATADDAIKGDVMDDIGDEMLQYEIDNLSQDEEDALGKAAREAVRKYEEDMMLKQNEKDGVRSAWDAEMVVPSFEQEAFSASEETAPESEAVDYSKMTVVQLKDTLRSKGLKVGGKKAELIERLEESS